MDDVNGEYMVSSVIELIDVFILSCFYGLPDLSGRQLFFRGTNVTRGHIMAWHVCDYV